MNASPATRDRRISGAVREIEVSIADAVLCYDPWPYTAYKVVTLYQVCHAPRAPPAPRSAVAQWCDCARARERLPLRMSGSPPAARADPAARAARPALARP